MELFFLIASFIGSWLLVAGSIYQAALELKDQDLERERLQAVRANIHPAKNISSWWWIFPPIKMYLEKKSTDQYRKEYFSALTNEDAEALLSFFHKASAWMFVAFGGFLIALKETYELFLPEHSKDILLFIGLIFVLAVASVLNTTLRIRRTNAILRTSSSKES